MEKTKVSMEEVEHVANLSRLTFNDDEKKAIQSDLSEIVNYFGVIGGIKVNAEDTKNKNYTIPREDRFKESLSKEDVVKNAPHKNDNAFIVPRVVE